MWLPSRGELETEPKRSNCSLLHRERDTAREKEMNGKKENERETEKDPETRRKWDRIQERNGDMQKWRSGKTSQGT